MQLADAGGGDALRRGAPRPPPTVGRTLEPTFAVETLALGDTLAPFGDRTAPDRPPLRSRRGASPRCAIATPAGRWRRSCSCRTASTRRPGPPAGRAAAAGVHARRPAPPRRRPIARCWPSRSATPSLTDSVVELSATIGARGLPRRAGRAARRRERPRRARPPRRPPADGTALTERFRVSPSLDGPSVYDVEIAAAPGELTTANNRQSVLVRPPGRARQVLLVEGAPGYEHSFIKRAWQLDRGLEVDALVRKGRDDKGRETYYVQAPRGRAGAARQRLPVDARGAVPLRRHRARQRRRRSARARPSSSSCATSSPSAAAAC